MRATALVPAKMSAWQEAQRRPVAACAPFRKTFRLAASDAGNHFHGGNSGRTRRLGKGPCARPAAERREGAARTRLDAETPRSRLRSRSFHDGRGCDDRSRPEFIPKNEKPADTAGLRQTSSNFAITKILERAKGLEPSTPTLARSCSTTELHPHPR